ncbi:MAG: DUF4260 domain-containing protein [Chitinophagaceae bacterium]
MKNILKLEEVGLFILCLFLFNQLPIAWWWFPALILAPDLSMLGYVAGNKAGAFCYNLFHHKGFAIVIYLLGTYLQSHWIIFAGILLLAHSSMDRVFGYGLKYITGFQYTHLGEIGKNASTK